MTCKWLTSRESRPPPFTRSQDNGEGKGDVVDVQTHQRGRVCWDVEVEVGDQAEGLRCLEGGAWVPLHERAGDQRSCRGWGEEQEKTKLRGEALEEQHAVSFTSPAVWHPWSTCTPQVVIHIVQ